MKQTFTRPRGEHYEEPIERALREQWATLKSQPSLPRRAYTRSEHACPTCSAPLYWMRVPRWVECCAVHGAQRIDVSNERTFSVDGQQFTLDYDDSRGVYIVTDGYKRVALVDGLVWSKLAQTEDERTALIRYLTSRARRTRYGSGEPSRG